MEGIKLLLLSCFIAVSTMCFSQESLNAVRNKAASGDAEAQYYLGWCYFNGKTVCLLMVSKLLAGWKNLPSRGMNQLNILWDGVTIMVTE